MTYLTLDQGNRTEFAHSVGGERWIVACLCAAWCDTCTAFRAPFEAWAARHPDLCFVWVDIEDQADVVGDLDVENFPTLLMQFGAIVTFFGPVLPDVKLAERLLQAQIEKSEAELRAQADGSAERRAWQSHCDLQTRVLRALGG